MRLVWLQRVRELQTQPLASVAVSAPERTPPEFDVVGIGNALVDVIAHADDAFIHAESLVKLKNVAEPASMSIGLAGGVLEMHCAYAQGASGMFSDDRIREVLMAAL